MKEKVSLDSGQMEEKRTTIQQVNHVYTTAIQEQLQVRP